MAEKKDSDDKIFAWLLLISLVAFGFYVYRWSTPESLIHIDRGMQNGTGNGTKTMNAEQTGLVRGETTAQCLESPRFDHGECGIFLGVYSSHGQCERIYGCDLNGDVPPFFSVGECQEVCQSAVGGRDVSP